jgi:hypothetical protein
MTTTISNTQIAQIANEFHTLAGHTMPASSVSKSPVLNSLT